MTDLTSIKNRFGIIGNSEALNRALEVALRVAPTDLSVLVTGESGVGKEFFPQVIHAYSARKHNKYIAVNCGAIPEGTIDSELFGHEKGAFTGAVEARKGYFEEADGGTIFLDEVAELRAKTPRELEIEAFVHGAMCVSYSGRCLLSNYMTGRDAQRGACAQPCRYKYALMEEKRPGEYFPVYEDEQGTYIMHMSFEFMM